MIPSMATAPIPVARQPDVIAAIEAAITSTGGSMRRACRDARVSRNSFYAWRTSMQDPTTAKLAALAAEAGYEIVMVGRGQTIDVNDIAAVMEALDAARKASGMSIWALAEKSGLPSRSYQYWVSGRREPTVLAISTLADTLGLRLLMRPREDPRVTALVPAVANSIMAAARV